MVLYQRFKKQAINKALQSICRFKVSALGFNKEGDCVAKACNRPRFVKKGGGVHAEALVMADHRKKGIVTVLICRVGRQGTLLPIDPCPECSEMARKRGIKIITIPGDLK